MPALRSALLLVAACSLAACAPYSTYPPIEAVGVTHATFEPIPTLIVESIRQANDEFGDGGTDYAYNLPRGTPQGVYTMVARRLGEGHPMREVGERAFHVQTVRTRGALAEVDIICPRPEGLYELVTISFRNELFKGWRVDRTRPWYIRVEPPAPNVPGQLVAEPGSGGPGGPEDDAP